MTATRLLGSSLTAAGAISRPAGLPVSSSGVLLVSHGSGVLSSGAGASLPADLYFAVGLTYLWNHEAPPPTSSTSALGTDVMEHSDPYPCRALVWVIRPA